MPPPAPVAPHLLAGCNDALEIGFDLAVPFGEVTI
jgi:hypothetical protein